MWVEIFKVKVEFEKQEKVRVTRTHAGYKGGTWFPLLVLAV